MNTAMMFLCMGIAATPLWPIYRTRALVVVVVAGISLGALIAIVGYLRRWRSPTVLLVTIAVFLITGVPLAVPSQARYGIVPTLAGLQDLLASVALGWKQLLTITLPVGQYQALLVPALVLTLCGTVVGLSVALRAARRELAVLAPAVVFIVATAFGPALPDRPVAVTLLLIVAILFWLVWFRSYRRWLAIDRLTARSPQAAAGKTRGESRVGGSRVLLAAIPIVAVACASSVAAVAVVPPSADRTVLRTTVTQPFDPRDYPSPLSAFRSYWQAPLIDSTLFRVTGMRQGQLLRLATMDTYDGVVFSVGSGSLDSESGSFTRVPSRVDQSGIDGVRQTVGVDVGDHAGPWLPTLGKLEAIDFTSENADALRDGFYYNDISGAAAEISELARSDSYSITAVIPSRPRTRELSTMQPGPAVVPTPRAVPEELTSALEQYTAGVSAPGERLVAALEGLKRNGYISHGVDSDLPASRSGHAADRIAELFTDPRMIGDAEQYAVAAALMADSIGFPSRVVLGFLPRAGVVTGSDVTAWIEVDTSDFGWVALDPNPAEREIPEEVPQDTSAISRPPSIVPPPEALAEPPDRQITPETQQPPPPVSDGWLEIVLATLKVLGVFAVVVAVLLAPFLVVILAKIRRRRLRRRARTPLARISGGWREFEDAVIDHGLSPRPLSTRSEIATLTGGVQAGVLAAIADRAVFSREESSSADADSVWRAVDDLEASLDEPLTRWQRIRARVSLRSLGGYGVRRFLGR